jgi:hypothetical protein
VARTDVLPVDVDVTAAVRMLDGIATRASGARLASILSRSAADAVSRIGSIAEDTGELRRSIQVRARSDSLVEIVATAPYARFVFRGTRYMDAQPPNVPADALARALADAVAREVFG